MFSILAAAQSNAINAFKLHKQICLIIILQTSLGTLISLNYDDNTKKSNIKPNNSQIVSSSRRQQESGWWRIIHNFGNKISKIKL